MNFIVSTGFDIKEGKVQQFQQWLKANEEKLAQETPTGCRYFGTFFAVQSSEKPAGSVRQLWQLENYGAMDSWTAAMKEGGAFTRLMEEYTEFIDQRNDAKWSLEILRRGTDAAVWGE